jgi:exodeoxyribonuclease VII large subunit
LDKKNQGFIAVTSKLDARSPLKVLTRGYAMAQKRDGTILKTVSQVEIGDRIHITVQDGSIAATVMDRKENV